MSYWLDDAPPPRATPDIKSPPPPSALPEDALRQAVREYLTELDGPAPDLGYRSVLRRRVAELVGLSSPPQRSEPNTTSGLELRHNAAFDPPIIVDTTVTDRPVMHLREGYDLQAKYDLIIDSVSALKVHAFELPRLSAQHLREQGLPVEPVELARWFLAKLRVKAGRAVQRVLVFGSEILSVAAVVQVACQHCGRAIVWVDVGPHWQHDVAGLITRCPELEHHFKDWASMPKACPPGGSTWKREF